MKKKRRILSLVPLAFGILFITIANSNFGKGRLDVTIGIMLIVMGLITLIGSFKK